MNEAHRNQQIPGSEPIPEKYMELGRHLDSILNGEFKEGNPRNIGFVLLIYPLDEDPSPTTKVSCVSNTKRSDVIALLESQIDQWKGN